jgi:7-keto-8-aminopelargonate synthetase-like enzyme
MVSPIKKEFQLLSRAATPNHHHDKCSQLRGFIFTAGLAVLMLQAASRRDSLHYKHHTQDQQLQSNIRLSD